MTYCERCNTELERYTDIENGFCRDCWDIEINEAWINAHNSKVEHHRQADKLTRTQRKHLATLRDNPTYRLRYTNPENENAEYYRIAKPVSKEWDNGQVDTWYEAVQHMTTDTGRVIEKHLYALVMNDRGGLLIMYTYDKRDVELQALRKRVKELEKLVEDLEHGFEMLGY